ncbi:MAG TPA: sulfotransferase [Acidimicrobiales bacterium]|nr:sulfotransferase [Acidimicrobiales bacterium]
MNEDRSAHLPAEHRAAPDHRVIFVGGLHRSGTSLLAAALAAHPGVSGFHGTGAAEDEGQHLQRVYPPVRAHGGPGRFANRAEAHLTETSPLVTPASAAALMEAWGRHWDLTKPVLVEKSPPNLIQARFLQALFAHPSFVMIVRHPLVVALATQRRARRARLGALLDHWFCAHRILQEDAPAIERLLVVHYEDLVAHPEACLARIAAFAGLASPLPPLAPDLRVSQRYGELWSQRRRSPAGRVQAGLLARRYEGQANRYGYTLADLERWAPGELASSP